MSDLAVDVRNRIAATIQEYVQPDLDGEPTVLFAGSGFTFANVIVGSLRESGVYLVTEETLTEALYSFHSWEPATARSEASAIIRALSRSLSESSK